MCWNADVQGKLSGIELNIHSGQARLCGLRLKHFHDCSRATPHTNSISGVRTSQSWAYPTHPGASGFRKAQETPWPPVKHLPGPDDSTSYPSTCVLSAGDKAAGSGFVAMCLNQCVLPLSWKSVSQICFPEWRILAVGPRSSVSSG